MTTPHTRQARERTLPARNDRPRWLRVSPKRALFMGLGLLSIGIGALGVVLPGLPTTIFVLAASYFFTRSCPYLEERLVRNRLFRPYLAYAEGTCPMPRRAKVVTLVVMWGSVTISVLTLLIRDRAPWWAASLLVLAALVGTWFITIGVDRLRRRA